MYLVGLLGSASGLLASVSLRKCFYLVAAVLLLSSLLAALIVARLSPLEAVKCAPAAPTPAVAASTADWTTPRVEPAAASASPRRGDERRYGQMRERMAQERAARLSQRMRARLPALLAERSVPTEPDYRVHAFYYAWYRSLGYDGAWQRWDARAQPSWKKADKHPLPEGARSPPADIAANFYPLPGPYSSRESATVDMHMRQLRDAGIGVAVVSWTPAPDGSDPLMPDLLDAAHRHQLRVCPHIEPYAGRNPINLLEHIRHILERYGSHPALHRMHRPRDGALLPVIYIYDSYVFPSSAWWELLSERGNLTLRGGELDAVYLGLLVDSQHRNHIKKSHFDGFYTYFAVNGFSYGSSWKNWRELAKFAQQNGLLFSPSVGPGYADTRLRPWNAENTRHRRHGQYYEVAWRSALGSQAPLVSISSFNQWHEGTQIEPARPASSRDFAYLDYEPEGPHFYLNLTAWWVRQFGERLAEATSALS